MATLTDFEEKVFRALKKIPRGKITTYKALARAIGRPRAVRAVGNVLNKNPNLINPHTLTAERYILLREQKSVQGVGVKCPCHRVVKSDGRVGGYARGEKEKIRLLRSEGVLVENGGIKNF